MPPILPISIAGKLASFSDQWSPKIIAELNGQHVRLARLQGEFIWHAHEHEDELFLILKGELTMRLREREAPDSPPNEREVIAREGEILIIPRGVEHLPIAHRECCVLLFEPASTSNTGTAVGERTLHTLERI